MATSVNTTGSASATCLLSLAPLHYLIDRVNISH